MTNLVEVRMGLFPETVEKITRLKDVTNSQTKADAVRRAVELTLMIADEIAAGGKVVMTNADGTEFELKLQ